MTRYHCLPWEMIALCLLFFITCQTLMPPIAWANDNKREKDRATAGKALQNEVATIYGPRQFVRGQGAPVTVSEDFSLPSNAVPPYTVIVQNGAPDGTNRVSSATIKLNGVTLFTSKEFNQNVENISKVVTLTSINHLEVELKSAQGSYLTITVTSNLSAIDTLTPATAPQGSSLSVTVRGINTQWVNGQTRLSLGGEISVGGAASGELGLVDVTDATTAIANVVISPTAALGPRTARMVTDLPDTRQEIETAIDKFTVTPLNPPGAT